MPTKSRTKRTPVLVLLLACSLVLLAGCGFQPRGQTVGSDSLPNPIRISGIPSWNDLYRQLDRQLAIAGVEVVTGETPAAVLTILKPRSDSQLLSVNSRDRAVEYEITEEAGFTLAAADGQRLLARQRLTVRRILYRPEVAVLGSDREAELLRRDMREELAGRIIRRLSAQRRDTE